MVTFYLIVMRLSTSFSHFFEIQQNSTKKEEKYVNQRTRTDNSPPAGVITKWKTEGTLPNGETLIKIADYLDVSIDYLVGRTDKPEINK